ncbi:hypothetical protein GGI42DRAFT_141943 [Trichoderma sp. SZMC 28013]
MDGGEKLLRCSSPLLLGGSLSGRSRVQDIELAAITGNSIVPLDPKGKMKKIPGCLCVCVCVLFLVVTMNGNVSSGMEWQRMHQLDGEEGEKRMQEKGKKKIKVAVLSFQTAAGRGETHIGWRLSGCPISGFFFFPSDKTSRAPPKIGLNYIKCGSKMKMREIAGLAR